MLPMMLFALGHRDDASVRHFAHHVLKLDGRVVDAEVVQQALLHVAQNPLAHRRRDVGD